jgi:protein TonB
MKCKDILLSTFIHAGLVVGFMYGLSQDSAIKSDEIEIEPIFFEILEESVTDSESIAEISEGSVPIKEGSVPLFSEGSVPMAMPVSASSVEPPSIEYSSDMIDEGPLSFPLPTAAKMPVDIAEGSVPTVDSAPQEQSRINSEPRALNRIVPVYPRSARRRGREGVVTLEILVSDTGNVSEAVVVAGSGHKDLDAAAVSAVRTARFAPATEDGVHVHGRLRLIFEFKLR